MADKILVADDEPDMEFLVTQMFRKQIREGLYEFVFVTDGKQALDYLEKNPDTGMLLTDINMPVMDGLTLLSKIKDLNRQIKTVVITAYGDFSNIRSAMNGGAFDFLIKPIDLPDFEATLNKIKQEYNFIKNSLEIKILFEKEKTEKEKAEHREKFERQFLANMSHEIRTPLNAISGMTQLMLMRGQSEENKTFLINIKKSSDNLVSIVNDILDLSKLEAGKIEFEKIPFSPIETAHHAAFTLGIKAQEKGLKFNVSASKDVPQTVCGDPLRLNQVLINIIGNAIKFTDKGSINVNIDCDLLEDNRELKSPELNNKVFLEFTITDTGAGMSPDQITKIFDEFSQATSDTARKYGGTGLGLSISRNIVNLLGGEISVVSEIGKGTEFKFIIPYELTCIVISDTPSMVLDDSTTALLSKLKILLAEDNEFSRMVAVDLISEMVPGISIDCALNGEEAVSMNTKNSYDLILMDGQMPVMSGMEATKKIRSMNNSIPIIFMTAGITPEEVRTYLESGADDYIAKPFDKDELIIKMAKFTVG